MLKLMVRIKTFLQSKKGQGMVEYGLIIGLVAVAAIAVLMAVSGSIGTLFTKVQQTLDGAAKTTTT